MECASRVGAEGGCVRRETVVNDRTGVEVGEESGETERSEVGKASRLNVLVQQGWIIEWRASRGMRNGIKSKSTRIGGLLVSLIKK